MAHRFGNFIIKFGDIRRNFNPQIIIEHVGNLVIMLQCRSLAVGTGQRMNQQPVEVFLVGLQRNGFLADGNGPVEILGLEQKRHRRVYRL